MRIISVCSVIIAAAGIATGAQASTTVSGIMPVTATAASSCAVAAEALAFGTISLTAGTASDTQTNVIVTCTPGINYEVGLDQGTHQAGGTRQMQAAIGTGSIPYLIYSNASRTTPWGNTVGSDTVTGTSTLTPTRIPVYGRIPANAPLAAAGLYTDAVTVTLTF